MSSGRPEKWLCALALLALSACTKWESHQPRFRCINGLLHVQFGSEAWVQADGHNYIGFTDGPMKCAEGQP